MGANIWQLVFAAGAAQGVFLGVTLFALREPNRRAARTLGLLVFSMTALVAVQFLDVAGLGEALPLLDRFAFFGELVVGPLILLFARFVGGTDRHLRRADVLLVLPLLVGLAWRLGIPTAGGTDGGFTAALALFVALKATVLIGFLVAAIRELSRSIDELAIARDRTPAKHLRRLRSILAILIGLGVAVYAAFAANVLGIRGAPDSDFVGSALLGLAIYLFAYVALSQRSLFATTEKYRSSGLSEGRKRVIAARVARCLEDRMPWVEAQFSLRDLATLVSASENHLSQVLNEVVGRGFHQLINEHRVKAFERAVGDLANDGRPILDLAFEAGFNSKASFYRAFRRIHRMSPTEYRGRTAEGSRASQSSRRNA